MLGLIFSNFSLFFVALLWLLLVVAAVVVVAVVASGLISVTVVANAFGAVCPSFNSCFLVCFVLLVFFLVALDAS